MLKKKKGFPDPCWFYQNSGSEWLAVVLAARVPKDNLLQNPLCWLRLRTGSKGHKCFAVKLQVLNFYLVLCNAHGFCGCGQTKAFLWFCLPSWTTQQMIWSEQPHNTLLCVFTTSPSWFHAGGANIQSMFPLCCGRNEVF